MKFSVDHRELYPQAEPDVLAGMREVLRRRRLSNAMEVEKLERCLPAYLGGEHAVAVSSCTTGLTLALRALRIHGPLLVPAVSFTAPVLAAMWNQLRLVFVPVSRDTYNLELDEVERAAAEVGPVGGVLFQAVGGNLAGLPELHAYCESQGIPLLVDGAGCFGSSVDGKRVGSLGTLSVVSFSSTKVVSGGEGGVVCCRSSELSADIQRLRTYGTTGGFVTEDLGTNGRLGELNAVLIRHSLPYAAGVIKNRLDFYERLVDCLADEPLVCFQRIDPRSSRPAGAVLATVPPAQRDRIIGVLAEYGIEAIPYYDPPVLRHPSVLGYPNTQCSEEARARAVELAAALIQLPIHSSFNGDTAAFFADAVKSCIKVS